MAKKRSYLFRGLLLSGVLLYIAGGVTVKHASSKNAGLIAENISYIRQAEAQPPVDYAAIMRERHAEEALKAAEEASEKELAEQRASYIKMYEEGTSFKNSDLIRMLKGTCIVGDSIVYGALEYSWLNKSIIHGKIGVSVKTGDALIDDAIQASPSVMYLCFGVNDIENYGSQVEIFIENYKKAIEKVKSKSPKTRIYVCALFPPKAWVLEKKSFYKNLDTYNTELEKLCSEEEVNFVDCGFLLTDIPELYDKDGVHPKIQFYPIWFTYLADAAGLSHD